MIEVRLDGAELVERNVHASLVLDEVDGSDGTVVDVEVGYHLEVGHSGEARVSIPQAPEVGFVEDVDELGIEGEVGVLYLTEDAKLFLVLANLLAHHHCSYVDVLGECARIGGPDEMRPRDLMIIGRGEAKTEESVCSPTEGRRNRRSIGLAIVVDVVDDLERRKYWFPWDDGEREIRLDGLGVGHVGSVC